MATAPKSHDIAAGVMKVIKRFVAIGATSAIALLLFTGCRTEKAAGHLHGGKAVESAPVAVREHTEEAQARITPHDALAELKAGNARFVAGKMRGRNLPEEVRATAAHQYPFAAIVSCIDSRVPPEMVFDQGIGDVFSARVAGNILNDDIVGSLEFACKVSGAKLIIVLGHSNCGAIKGAIDDVQLGQLTGLLAKVKPAEDRVAQSVQPRTSKNKEFVQQVAEQNDRLVMQQIRERSPVLREMLDAGKIGLAGGMYDLTTGETHLMAN
jgi:carbonic anhydrase